MRLAALARAANPRCRIVAGGPHATPLPHHLLEHYPQVDVVVRGEGEETLLEVARAHGRGNLDRALPAIPGVTFRAPGRYTGRLVNTPERPGIMDLDTPPQ